jgi:hypothetical protein
MDFKKSWTKTVTEQEAFLQNDQDDLVDETILSSEQERHYLPPFSGNTMHLEDHGLNNPSSFRDACTSGVDSFVLRNVSQIYLNASQSLNANELGQGLYVVVKKGEIACLGVDCNRDHVEWPISSPVFEMGGAVVIPVRRRDDDVNL